MGEHSTDPLIGAYHTGYLKCISRQLTGIKARQELHQASLERQIVLAGQILEAIRHRQPEAQPTFGLMKMYARVRDAWEHFERLQKVVSVLRAVRWGSLGWTAYGLFRWAGLI